MTETDRTPVRLLGFAGSLRREAFSKAVVRGIAERQKAPVTMTVFDLGEVPLYNQDLDGENQPPPVEAFKAAIAEADGLVIVTPEYNYGIPGVMKNALDWASRPGFDSVLKDKPVLPVSSSPGLLGGVRALAQLKGTLLATLSRVILGPEVVIGQVKGKVEGGRLVDETSLGFAQAQVDALVAAIRSNRAVKPTRSKVGAD
ncbi:MAG: NADPH-dependent FMN reductase [Kiloniellales bacterium]